MASPRTCRDCGAPLEPARTQWVDARSGDDGGTYDICPARFDARWPDDAHGHRPEPLPAHPTLEDDTDRAALAEAIADEVTTKRTVGGHSGIQDNTRRIARNVALQAARVALGLPATEPFDPEAYTRELQARAARAATD